MREIVFVEWQDSARPVSEWHYISDFEAQDVKPIRCNSVGWVIRETEDFLQLAPNVGDVGKENAQASGVITIPTRSIVYRTKLWPVDIC